MSSLATTADNGLLSPLSRWFPPHARRSLIETAAVALLFCVGFLLLPLAGTDLSAQVARGHFFEEYGGVIDFRWYGGTHPFGYSLLTGPANAFFGSRGTGAVACVVAAMAFAWLAAKTGVKRPTAGGVACALLGVFNLISGRTTFALGLAFALLALCALVAPVSRRSQLIAAGVCAALATAGSPVAGAFVMLAGAALFLGGRWVDGVVLTISAALLMAPTAVLFKDGGPQPFTFGAFYPAALACVIAFFLIPRTYRFLRIGALLAGIAVTLTFLLPTPMGSNVVRLPMLFAIPVVIAVATIRLQWLTAAVVLLAVVHPPLMVRDLARAGETGVKREFFVPLIAELENRAPIGRIEVVPLSAHWESVYVGEAVPLARGWLRQADTDRNPLFYDGTLNPETYKQWLYDNGVEYVALAKNVRLDWAAREEAALVGAGLPYLEQVWSSTNWVLYAVENPVRIVAAPAELLMSGPRGVQFAMPESGTVIIRVHWSRWLVLQGPHGCLERTPGTKWVQARVLTPGTYTLTSNFSVSSPSRC